MDKNKVKKTAETAANVSANTVGGVIRAILKVIATILLIFLTTGLLFTCIFAFYVKNSLSESLDITLEDVTLNQASTVYYLDKNGGAHELATLHGEENRIWVDYENIPKYMSQAAIAIEDKRFMEHKGVDWYRTFGAFVNMFATMKDDFGGSTLTQQLIKNITKEDDITVQRKLLEIFRALDFERRYEKDEILEWYLNVIFLGEGCNGVGTAAEAYFGKNVWDLSLAECASIIGITNNPSKYDPFISEENNKKRQETILWEMYDQGMISYEDYEAAKNEKLVFTRAEKEERVEEIREYYTDALIKDVIRDIQEARGVSEKVAHDLVYNGGLQIYACMDRELQDYVNSVYADPSNFPATVNAYGETMQSAAVLLDPYTGAIKAIAGGVGADIKKGNFVLDRATIAQRAPGSSFKPIATYGPAVDQGLITPSTMVNDSPNIKLSGSPNWYPRNAGGGNSGIITILTAITKSLNTVSAQILDKLGVDQSYNYLTERLGFTSLDPEKDKAYAPLSLGQLTYGCTVREMAQAYSAFVNDGVFTYSRFYSHITDSEGNMVLDNTPKTIVAFKANTAWTMSYMLSNAAAYGTGAGSYAGGMPLAGKTGSSTDYKDRWFVGFTPYYVCAVWTGYDDHPTSYSGSNPAIPVWNKIMTFAHEGLEYRTFKTPTLGGPTNIFGDLHEEETEEPTESPEESPEESPTDSPSESPINSPDVSPEPPTASIPVSPPIVTDDPTPTPPPPPTQEPVSPFPSFDFIA